MSCRKINLRHVHVKCRNKVRESNAVTKCVKIQKLKYTTMTSTEQQASTPPAQAPAGTPSRSVLCVCGVCVACACVCVCVRVCDTNTHTYIRSDPSTPGRVERGSKSSGMGDLLEKHARTKKDRHHQRVFACQAHWGPAECVANDVCTPAVTRKGRVSPAWIDEEQRH
jgi:hypothetical protein